MTVTATAPKPAKPRIRWAAGADRIAHAHRAGNAPRTLCEQPAVADSLAWPELRRCLACRSLADELGAAA